MEPSSQASQPFGKSFRVTKPNSDLSVLRPITFESGLLFFRGAGLRLLRCVIRPNTIEALTISEVFGRNGPSLVAVCQLCSFSSPALRSELRFAKASLFSAACLVRSFSTARAQAFGAPPAETLLGDKSGRTVAVIVFT
jgi:hypothetical protein